jgi:hypothetical protein
MQCEPSSLSSSVVASAAALGEQTMSGSRCKVKVASWARKVGATVPWALDLAE